VRRVRLACFLGCDYLAAFVLTALVADSVGKLALLTVGADGGADRSEEVVAAPLGGALFGVAAFRIRHCGSLSNGRTAETSRAADAAGESEILI
jgi:hypothetical protein